MAQRLIVLDFARAIAIVLVVIGHYIPENSPNWYQWIHDVIYQFHMPLFLFVSGYVYVKTNAETSICGFWKKKFLRLLLPYFVVSIFVLMVKLLAQEVAYVENPITYKDFFQMLYLPVAGYYLWFLWALWWMFVVVYFFKTRKSRCALLGLSFILYCLPIQLTEVLCLRQFQMMFLYFMMGCFWGDFLGLKWLEHKTLPFVLFVMFIACQFFPILTVGTLSVVAALLGIGMCLSYSQLLVGVSEKVKTLFFRISAASFVIYLFHTMFEGGAKAVLVKMPITDNCFFIQAFFVIFCGVWFPLLLETFILCRFNVTRFVFGLRSQK